MIKKALIPYPQYLEEKDGEKKIAVISKPFFQIVYKEGGEVFQEAVSLVKQSLCDIAMTTGDANADYCIIIKKDANDIRFKETGRSDAYYIEIDEKEAVLCGYDDGGVYYAATTFAQLLYAEGNNVYLPFVSIIDYPDFAHRGLFIESSYGTDFMTKKDWFDAIDYLSSMKYNQLTLGIYGCWGVECDRRLTESLFIPIKKYPQLKTPRNVKYYSVSKRKWIYKKDILPTMFTEDCLGEIISYAKKNNIKFKLQFNSLGHNTLLPRMFPEVSAKDENGNDTGFGFCTQSQATLDLMFDIYDEIIDRYLVPYGVDAIEIGLDEVDSMIGINPDDLHRSYSPKCLCDKCMDKEQISLMVDYIVKLCKYLKGRGMKSVYIYHDMLFRNNHINEDLAERLKAEDVYDTLVIDWWSYTYEKSAIFGGRADDVNGLLRSIIKPMTGFYHWMIPTNCDANIRSMTCLAKEKGHEGIEAYSSFEYCYDMNYLYQAELSWNTKMLDDGEDFRKRYAQKYYQENASEAQAVFDLLTDAMKHDGKFETLMLNLEYYFHGYLNADKPYPRNFPEDAFVELEQNKEVYMVYLNKLRQNTEFAMNFFKAQMEAGTSEKHMNSVWLLTATHYFVLSDEYLTLLTLETAEPKTILLQLQRLIKAREDLMRLVEETRIEANHYQYLRNMSIFRQFLLDLYDYVINCIQRGKAIQIDLKDLKEIKSDVYDFLR